MDLNDFRSRMGRLEASIGELVTAPSTDQELFAAMEKGTVTPVQMTQVFTMIEDDLRTQMVLMAAQRRLFYAEGGTLGWVTGIMPVDWAVEILTYWADEIPGRPFETVPYEPEVWIDPTTRLFAPGDRKWHSVWWARFFLMQMILGNDGGLAMREGIDRWWEGGDPPVDVERFPQESTYWLIEPIDTVASIVDLRLLRTPTRELYERIGTYDRFDTFEPGHYWTLWTPPTDWPPRPSPS